MQHRLSLSCMVAEAKTKTLPSLVACAGLLKPHHCRSQMAIALQPDSSVISNRPCKVGYLCTLHACIDGGDYVVLNILL